MTNLPAASPCGNAASDRLISVRRRSGASANADQALAVPVEPSGLAPPGFDPSRIAVMAELSALWFAYATAEGGHKDRDCHFIIEQYFSYGAAPYWTAYHAGYVDDGFGVTTDPRGRTERRFPSYDQALEYCIAETLAMFRRHYRDLPVDTIGRLKELGHAPQFSATNEGKLAERNSAQ